MAGKTAAMRGKVNTGSLVNMSGSPFKLKCNSRAEGGGGPDPHKASHSSFLLLKHKSDPWLHRNVIL